MVTLEAHATCLQTPHPDMGTLWPFFSSYQLRFAFLCIRESGRRKGSLPSHLGVGALCSGTSEWLLSGWLLTAHRMDSFFMVLQVLPRSLDDPGDSPVAAVLNISFLNVASVQLTTTTNPGASFHGNSSPPFHPPN
jgi:hypothetical protein